VGFIETALAWSIPGTTLLMLAAGGFELWRQRRGKTTGTPVTGTYVDEFTAVFYGTKRVELDHRDSISMMREEDAQGAPPLGIDLDSGTAKISLSGTGASTAPTDQPSPRPAPAPTAHPGAGRRCTGKPSRGARPASRKKP